MASFFRRFLSLNQRVDDWARSRMCTEAYAEASEMDRSLRRNPWKWLGIVVASVATATGLVYAVSPSMGWGSAFLITVGIGMLLVMIIASPYFGYRRIARKPGRLFATIVGSSAASAIVGLLAVMLLDPSRDPHALMHDKFARALALSVLLGVAVASVSIGIARMRLRQANERTERMAAEAERERLAHQSVQAELKMLQAQVEPHFLFNTLANVRQLVQSGSGDALRMLDHLIDYLRSALPDMRSEASTLGREAELARAYLEIMRMRMGGGLRFSVEVPPELQSHRFPPLMLMTLVENAVKHGVGPVGRGEIRIDCTARDGGIVVRVSDDGRGLAGALGSGVGLANVRERLGALYGERACLVLESGPEGGTTARLELPA